MPPIDHIRAALSWIVSEGIIQHLERAVMDVLPDLAEKDVDQKAKWLLRIIKQFEYQYTGEPVRPVLTSQLVRF